MSGKIGLKKNWNFKKVLGATLISRFGDAIDSIAISWLVYVLTGSKLLMGTLFALSYVPNLIMTPIGGVVADVFPKKKTVVLGDFGRGILAVCLGLAYYFQVLEVWHLIVFTLLNSTLESFAEPSRGALFPLLVDKEDIVSARGMSSTIQTIGTLGGLGAAGMIISFIDISGAIWVDAATFFASGLLVSIIKLNEKIKKDVKLDFNKTKQLMKEGAIYVKGRKVLMYFVMAAAFINFAFVPFNVLRPVYVDEVLKSGAAGLSLTGMGLMFGMLLGGILVAKLGSKLKIVQTIGLGIFFVGLAYAALAIPNFIEFSPSIALYFAIGDCLLFGLCIPFIQAPLSGYLMKTTDPDKMGRVMSILNLINLSTVPIGGFLVGALGEYFSVSTLFIVMGLMSTLGAVLFILNPTIKKEFKKDELEQSA